MFCIHYDADNEMYCQYKRVYAGNAQINMQRVKSINQDILRDMHRNKSIAKDNIKQWGLTKT